jgi:hypothetical protein
MDNNGDESPTTATRPSLWQRYRDKRMAHTRDLRQLAIDNRESPRCSKCSIVLGMRPDAPCQVADCPLRCLPLVLQFAESGPLPAPLSVSPSDRRNQAT